MIRSLALGLVLSGLACSSGGASSSVGGGAGGGSSGAGGGAAAGGGSGGGSGCAVCDPTRANNSCGASGCECAGGAQCPVGIVCGEGSGGGAPIGTVCLMSQTSNQVVTATTPPRRYAAAMSFDSTRNKTVLFGGIDNGVALGDTWEYDGIDWRLVADAGSFSGGFGVMVFDPVRQRTDLYGGLVVDGGTRGWSWDGTAWTGLPTALLGGPIQAAIWDTGRSRAVALIAAECGAQTWERVGLTWTRIADAGAVPNSGSLAYDPAARQTVYYGEDPPPRRSEGGGGGGGGGAGPAPCTPALGTWIYDGASWTRQVTAGSPPAPTFYGQRMIYQPSSASIAMTGGTSSTFAPYPQYLWRYFNRSWTKHAGPSWQPRYLHGIAYDAARQKIVLFGGSNGNNALDDTWEL